MEIIGGHPCKYCNSRSKEVSVDFQYYWVDTGLVLVEKTTRYICEMCGVRSIQIIEHWEEREEQKTLRIESTHLVI